MSVEAIKEMCRVCDHHAASGFCARDPRRVYFNRCKLASLHNYKSKRYQDIESRC